jgi:hypothetical protein
LDEDVVAGLMRVASAVRRFPLPLENQTCVFMKLKMTYHGTGNEERESNVGPVTLEERYERLEKALQNAVPTEAAASNQERPVSVARSTSKTLEADNKTANAAADWVNVVAQENGVVSHVFVSVNDAIFCRKCVVTLSLEDQIEEDALMMPSDGYSMIQDMNLYYSGYSKDYSSKKKSVVSLSRASKALVEDPEEEEGKEEKDEEKTKDYRWDCEEPGIVTAVHVAVGSFVKEGDVLLSVSISRKDQHLAHLKAADGLGFLIAKRNVSSVNARFQSLTENLVQSTSEGFSSDILGAMICCRELEQLTRDFSDTARTYGRVIISEMNLPLEQKTVRPLKLGGVLGGDKYVVRGVLFKIPDGSLFSSYPDPIYIANKIQGHELKGLKAYFGWFFNRGHVGLVSFPLTAVIDFKGHRITAMTQLPIEGNKSLIYGSDDAGEDCNVRNEVAEWSQFIREASLGLNLKAHHVFNGRASGKEIELVSCVDLEGHKGGDKRFYLLDFSRTFPPAHKEKEQREAHDRMWPFYHMLRSEFVASWKTSLCADAFSNFQSTITSERETAAKAQNEEIREATRYLLDKVALDVCHSLLQSTDKSTSLTRMFHQKGLNMRYLGLVYKKLVGNELYSRAHHSLYRSIQAEALMRVLKNHLRKRLRVAPGKQAKRSEGSTDSVLRMEAKKVLNNFFGHCVNFSAWVDKNPFVFSGLEKDFYFGAKQARTAVDTLLSQSIVEEVNAQGEKSSTTIKFVVLKRLNQAVGLGIRQEVLDQLSTPTPSAFSKGRSFLREQIIEDFDLDFQERVKILNVVERSRGLSQYLSGTKESLLAAFETIEGALEASPTDPWLCLLMAEVCQELWQVMTQENVKLSAQAQEKTDGVDVKLVKALADELVAANMFGERADSYYQLAVAGGGQVMAYRSYGKFLLVRKQKAAAEDFFLKALEAGERQGKPVDEESVVCLVGLLKESGQYQLAKKLKEKTKTFFHYRDSWMNGTPLAKMLVEAGAQIAEDDPALVRASGGEKSDSSKNVRMGMRSSTLTASSSSSITGSPSMSKNIGKSSPPMGSSQPIKVMKRAVRKVGDTIRRKSPSNKQALINLASQRGSSDTARSFVSDSGRSSAANSQIFEEEEEEEEEVDEVAEKEFVLAMKRNLELRTSAIKSDEEDEEEEEEER